MTGSMAFRGYIDLGTFFMSVVREVAESVEQHLKVKPQVLQVIKTFSFCLPIPIPFDLLMDIHASEESRKVEHPFRGKNFQDPRLMLPTLHPHISRINNSVSVDSANVIWYHLPQFGHRVILEVQKPIKQGEELLQRYNCDSRR